MKRINFITNVLIAFALLFSSQMQGQIIDDIYLTPNDEVMTKKIETKKERIAQNPTYKNGAREIIFIDQNGNRTDIASDTVYVINEEVEEEDINQEVQRFNDESELEYTNRINRFHGGDRYFLIEDPDDFDYYPYSSNWNWSWSWRSPYWSSYNYGWNYYNPWYSDYWGYGYPYHYGYGWDYWGWNSYYGWGYPYYYGGYYGWDYPYYGGHYGGWYSDNYYNRGADNSFRRKSSNVTGNRMTYNSSTSSSPRRVSESSGVSRSNNPYTVVGTRRSGSSVSTRTGATSVSRGDRPVRISTYGTRTNNSNVVNASSPSRTYNTRSGNTANSSRGSSSSYSTGRSERQTYSAPSRSSSTYDSSSSSSSYSSGSRSSGGYSGGGSSSSGRSGSSGGGRR